MNDNIDRQINAMKMEAINAKLSADYMDRETRFALARKMISSVAKAVDKEIKAICPEIGMEVGTPSSLILIALIALGAMREFLEHVVTSDAVKCGNDEITSNYLHMLRLSKMDVAVHAFELKCERMQISSGAEE